MSKAKRQMPERTGRVGVAHGEAVRDPISDEARDPLAEHQDTGSAKPKAGTGGLLEKALTRENLQVAWKRVKANKGAAGVDGLDIEQTAQAIRNRWPQIRQQLLAGRYRPSPVRKVMIPKPDGSQRELGIPIVVSQCTPYCKALDCLRCKCAELLTRMRNSVSVCSVSLIHQGPRPSICRACTIPRLIQ